MPLRILKFKCIMGTLTYEVADGYCVLGFYKSWRAAKARLTAELAKPRYQMAAAAAPVVERAAGESASREHQSILQASKDPSG